VNKVATKAELLFDLQASLGLSDREKEKIQAKLGSRINSDGLLSLAEQGSRSQLRNKREVRKRFFKLLEDILRPRKRRKGAPKLKANPRKRLEAKRRQSEKKALRKKVDWP
jgi:ribosome-associated protein